jgi:putative transposase
LGVGVEAAVLAAENWIMIKGRPPRLEQIFQTYDPPLYFITICTIHRQKIVDLDTTHHAFEYYVRRARDEFGVAIGRYLIMPDQMHFFVQGGDDFELAQWVNGLKRVISVAFAAPKKNPLWQRGFFDHALRNDESYSQKWEYVRENPVRAGLVRKADEWPFEGEIVVIDRA